MALQAPFYPIIYVRGYAMTQGEIDDTSADPFCGFNLGSTVYRATVDYDRARKFVFESPMVRLASDFGYVDAFESGYDIVDPDWPSDRYLDARSVVPVIRDIHGSAEAMRVAELERAQRMLARGDDPAAVLEALSQSLTRKFLHGPTHALNTARGESREQIIHLIPELFRTSGSAEK